MAISFNIALIEKKGKLNNYSYLIMYDIYYIAIPTLDYYSYFKLKCALGAILYISYYIAMI